jgi:aarF domain-containing kinase
MKTDLFLRSFQIIKLATQVGLKEFQSKDFKSRLEQANLIVKNLANLKGAAMKAGQLLSLNLEDYFPPEAIEVLSQLHQSAEAYPYDEIEKILKKHLTAKSFQKLKNISKVPIGVASIGQVHKANFEGLDIVLKIQYPKVSESINSDLKLLKLLAVSFCKMSGKQMNLDLLFKEFKEILKQEVDYLAEAQYQKLYFEKVLNLKKNSDYFFKVPQIINELSSKKVLAMSFEDGVSLRHWINKTVDVKQRHKLGCAFLDLYFTEFFDWGLVQTDPNPGNFLITNKKELIEICLLDFGATKKYDTDFVQKYTLLLKCAFERDKKNLKKYVLEFDLIDNRESEEAFDALFELFEVSIRPFRQSVLEQIDFDFSNAGFLMATQESSKKVLKTFKFSPPPHNIVFLHRKLAGVYGILKQLEVKIDLVPYWKRILK